MTVNDALRRFVGDYRAHHRPTPHQDRVLDWLCACRTAALGGRLLTCACGWSAPIYNSCADRHCPQCRGAARQEWLVARQAQLLPVPHFQVVATLPGVLRPIARDNPEIVYALLFRAIAETLEQLARQRWNAQLGIVAVLHTWTQDLRYHPHVHCLVTAGGWRAETNTWVASRSDFLFPKRVIAAMVRGKVTEGLRAAFEAGDLFVRGDPEHRAVTLDVAIREAWRHRWVVHIEAPEGRPVDLVAKYLTRYVYGNAIGNGRLVEISETHVSFRAREGGVRLAGREFVRRFVSHILPRRFKRARYYGLYAPGNVHSRWLEARQALDAPEPADRGDRPRRTCPVCGRVLTEQSLPDLPRMRPLRPPPRARGPP